MENLSSAQFSPENIKVCWILKWPDSTSPIPDLVSWLLNGFGLSWVALPWKIMKQSSFGPNFHWYPNRTSTNLSACPQMHEKLRWSFDLDGRIHQDFPFVSLITCFDAHGWQSVHKLMSWGCHGYHQWGRASQGSAHQPPLLQPCLPPRPLLHQGCWDGSPALSQSYKTIPVRVTARVAGNIHCTLPSAAHAVKWSEDKSASKDWIQFLTWTTDCHVVLNPDFPDSWRTTVMHLSPHSPVLRTQC